MWQFQQYVYTDSVSFRGSQVTCAHDLAELNQALEGKTGDMRRTPFSCGGVDVLLIAHPAAGLLPGVALELIQLNVGLRSCDMVSSLTCMNTQHQNIKTSR